MERRTTAATLVAAALAQTVAAWPAGAADPSWPTSRDFARDSLVPSLYLGETHRGWTDYGGGWITDDGPGGEELWQLYYERDGEAAVAIVSPEAYSDDGSVETWRVLTSLLIPAGEDPMLWNACWLAPGSDQPVYTRWSEERGPSDVWTFEPDTMEFWPVAAADVVCDAYGPE